LNYAHTVDVSISNIDRQVGFKKYFSVADKFKQPITDLGTAFFRQFNTNFTGQNED
jgi:hypothetical protein